MFNIKQQNNIVHLKITGHERNQKLDPLNLQMAAPIFTARKRCIVGLQQTWYQLRLVVAYVWDCDDAASCSVTLICCIKYHYSNRLIRLPSWGTGLHVLIHQKIRLLWINGIVWNWASCRAVFLWFSKMNWLISHSFEK